jgi:hypothetical protein
MAHLRAMAKLVRDAGTAKLAFSGNDASAYGCPKNALCLGGGSGPIVGAGVPA